MLAGLLGSTNKERALVFLIARGQGHARELARFFDAPLRPVQNALDGLEAAGVLVSRTIGTARIYEFSPRYPARTELAALVEKALSLYPAELREKLTMPRNRPRRKGKPL